MMEKTKKYRQAIVRLSSSPNAITWHTSQHILDKLWRDQNHLQSDKERKARQTTIYGCQTCGALVHPGFMGTSLRVCRRKKDMMQVHTRTLRRREQRNKKKHTFDQQKDAKDPNKRRKLSEVDNSYQPKFILLADDHSLLLDRHHLAINCGRCRAKIRCKGIKKEPTKSELASTVKEPKMQSTATNSNEILTSKENGSDYMQLPSLVKTENKKKSKNKKKQKETSNLLNFLSSLND